LHSKNQNNNKEDKISTSQEHITFSMSGKKNLCLATVAEENIVPIMLDSSNSTINPDAFHNGSPSAIKKNNLMH
jgi:hypothetical protein